MTKVGKAGRKYIRTPTLGRRKTAASYGRTGNSSTCAVTRQPRTAYWCGNQQQRGPAELKVKKASPLGAIGWPLQAPRHRQIMAALPSPTQALPPSCRGPRLGSLGRAPRRVRGPPRDGRMLLALASSHRLGSPDRLELFLVTRSARRSF